MNLAKFLRKLFFTEHLWMTASLTGLHFMKATWPLHKKWSFPLRISSINVTKSVVSCGFRHIYWRNPKWKTSFFVHDRDLWNSVNTSAAKLKLRKLYKTNHAKHLMWFFSSNLVPKIHVNYPKRMSKHTLIKKTVISNVIERSFLAKCRDIQAWMKFCKERSRVFFR